MNKSFAGFVVGAAARHVRAAKSVALYVKKRSENKSDILIRIDAALKAGKIDEDWRDTLENYLEQLHEVYVKSGRLVDERDPRDWRDIGNGARMRKRHVDSDQLR